MTRYLYGGTADAVVLVPTPTYAGPAGNTYNTPAASAVGSLWTAQSGGTQVTDLLTYPGGAAATTISQVNGFITQFQGPDSLGTQNASFWSPNLWADFGGGSRTLIKPISTLVAGNVISVSPSAGVVDISSATPGSVMRVNVNANITGWTLGGTPGVPYSFQVVLTMDATSGRTVVWPSAANVKYPSGYSNASLFTPGIANAVSTYRFTWDGTNWYIDPDGPLVNPISVTPSAGVLNLSACLPGSTINISLNANVTSITLPPVVAGSPSSYDLIFTEDATGGRTVAWPASVKWPGGASIGTGVVPVIANAVSSFRLYYDGTNWWLHQNTFDTGWISVTGGVGFLNAWVDFDGRTVQYRRVNGDVMARGLAKSGTVGSPMFALPVGFRPDSRVTADLNMATASNSAFGLALVNGADGNVTPSAGSNAWFSLDNLRWRVAGT